MLCKTHRDANSLTGYWCYFKNTFHKNSTEGNITTNTHLITTQGERCVFVKTKPIHFVNAVVWKVACCVHLYVCEWQRAVCDLLSSVSLWMLELMLCTRALGSSGVAAWYDMVEVCKVTWELSEEQALCVTSQRADLQKLAIYQTLSWKMEQTKGVWTGFPDRLFFFMRKRFFYVMWELWNQNRTSI